MPLSPITLARKRYLVAHLLEAVLDAVAVASSYAILVEICGNNRASLISVSLVNDVDNGRYLSSVSINLYRLNADVVDY